MTFCQISVVALAGIFAAGLLLLRALLRSLDRQKEEIERAIREQDWIERGQYERKP
jgi:hypothetical protein